MKNRRSARTHSALAAAARSCLIESMEARRLFAATVISQLPSAVGPEGSQSTIDLSPFFDDPTTAVTRITTSLGDIRIRLFQSQKPLTVANFLKYVTQSRYNGTIIHRSDPLNGDPNLVPDIIQGGGYAFPGFAHIATDPPVVNEFATNGEINNTRGTIAMAKTSDPNSATSEWFINVKDTTAELNNTSNSGGFTVFGQVFTADLPVVDQLAALPRFAFSSPFTALPLRNFTQTDFTNQVTPGANNVVAVSATQDPELTYAVSSSNPAIATPTISGKNVVLNYGTTIGTSTITLTATDLDGVSVQSTFSASVGQLDVTIGGASGNKSVTYADTDGTVTTISAKGAGTTSLRFGGGSLAQTTSKGKVTVTGTTVSAANLTVVGSNATTAISISSKGGDGVATLGGLSADGALKSLSAKRTTFVGGLTTVGPVGKIDIGSASGATIALGGLVTDKPVSMTALDLTDTDLTSGTAIKSLKIRSAVDTDSSSDVVAAPGVSSISSSGNFANDINLTPGTDLGSLKVGGNLTGDVSAHRIGSISVKGTATGSTIIAAHLASEVAGGASAANKKANQAINAIKVSGAITNVIVNSGGSLGSISAGSISGSRIFAGLPTATALPTTLADLSEPATLGSVKVKGLFANTLISSRFLGKVSFGTVELSNGGTPFGFAADTFASLSGKSTAGAKISAKKLDIQSDFVTQTTGVVLGDLIVQLL